MNHDGHVDVGRQRPEHRAQNGQGGMRATAWPGLQDDRHTQCLRGGGIGARILPPQTDDTGDGAAIPKRGLQHVGQGNEGHLNLATISMMPGIVCSCSACVGWKYCFSDRWLSPPRMVK